jgi:hypothetical protein
MKAATRFTPGPYRGRGDAMSTTTSRFRIGFHWGTVDGNGCLLQAGGTPARPHFHDLADGYPAALNVPVMQQVRHWYRLGGRTDSAGPGMYFSGDLFNSRRFGPDLLTLDFHAEHGGDWDSDTLYQGNPKPMADAALDKGSFQSLPLMARSSDLGWYVILRAQSEGRNTGVKVTFHPPTAEDVIQVWRYYTSEAGVQARCAFVGQVAEEVIGRRVTRPAEILFHRLLCDHASEDLVRFRTEDWRALAADSSARTSVGHILSGLRALMPGDPRTATIARAWNQVA